ncbi:MAG: NTP transferase domain-containing protein [Phycisphaera sp.]|nr:NTP transferase domain-containing protein [Phycisphaera sp.]
MISRAPDSPWPHPGAILCGGHSARMGVPKAGMLLPDGRSMLERTRDMLESFCSRVLLLGDSHGVAGHQCLKDLRPDTGPLGAIESLLESGIASQYLVVPCDLPLLPAGLLARLLVGDEDGMSCFEAPGDDRIGVLPCRIGAECLDEVRDLLDAGEHSVRQLVDRLGPDATRIPLARRELDLLMNVNTPEDFERACRLMRAEPDPDDTKDP